MCFPLKLTETNLTQFRVLRFCFIAAQKKKNEKLPQGFEVQSIDCIYGISSITKSKISCIHKWNYVHCHSAQYVNTKCFNDILYIVSMMVKISTKA